MSVTAKINQFNIKNQSKKEEWLRKWEEKYFK